MNDFEVVGTVRVNDDGSLGLINGSLDVMGSKVGGLSSIMQAFGSVAQFVWANIVLQGINAAVSAVTNFGSAIIKGAESIQQSHALINQALISTKDASGLTADQLDKYALAISKTTKFSMDQVLQAESTGLMFTNLNKNVWPQTINLAADLATKMGTNMQSAMMMLGRSLQDPINGFGRLTMVIGQVDPAMKKQIETEAKAGDIAKAQADILQVLQQRLGGAAKAAGETFSGAWARLSNDVQDSMEVAMLPLLQTLADVMDKLMQSGIVDQFANSMANLITQVGEFVSGLSQIKTIDVNTIFKSIGDFIGTNLTAFTTGFYNAAKSVDWKKVSEVLADGIRSINWSQLGTDLNTGITNIIHGLVTIINQTDWGALLGAILTAMGDFIVGFLKPGATFQHDITDVWTSDWDQLVQIVGKMRGNVVAAVKGWFSDLDAALRSIAQLFFDRAMGWVQQAAKGLIGSIGILILAINQIKAEAQAIIGVGIRIPVSLDLPSLGGLENLLGRIQALTGLGGGGGGGGGGAATHRRALGGPVSSGNFYVVGEHGPEIFVPDISGMIIPNYGRSTSNTQTVGAGSSNFYFYGNVTFGGTPANPADLMQSMRRT